MVGSYPKMSEKGYKVILTLESRDSGALERAFKKLTGLLPAEIVVATE